MTMELDDIYIYEVHDADDEIVGYSLDKHPGTADVEEGRFHGLIADESVASLWLVGFHTIREAMAYGMGAQSQGDDVVGVISKYITPKLSVCLLEWFEGNPEIYREDLRPEL